MVQGHGKNCVGGAEICIGTQWLREGEQIFSLGKARVQKEENERPQKEPGEGRVAGQSLTEGGWRGTV